MKIFNKENCCLCLSLRTGTLIIGWFQVIICVFIIFKTLGDWPKANKNESEKWVHYGDEWKEKIANIENITRSYSFLIYSSAGFSSAVFLLIGVYGKCFFLIVQWVVVFSAGMVVNLYMFINFLQRSFKVDIQTFWTVFLAIFVFGKLFNLHPLLYFL